jgi:hypothetical protein
MSNNAMSSTPGPVNLTTISVDLPGTPSSTLTSNNTPIKPPIDIYSVGLIRDTKLNNCLNFDGTNLKMKGCPLVLNQYDDTYRFKFVNGEIHDVKDEYCFLRNQNKEFTFEKIKTYDSWTNNCYKFQKDIGLTIKSDKNTCLGNNLDKVLSIPCDAGNWQMTMNIF